MKLPKKFLVFCITLAFVLASCGPSRQEMRDEIEKSMKGWVGKSETELVAKWGPPENVYKMRDGSRELTYIHWNRYASPYYAPYRSRSERGFTIDPNGTVVAYRWDGF